MTNQVPERCWFSVTHILVVRKKFSGRYAVHPKNSGEMVGAKIS